MRAQIPSGVAMKAADPLEQAGWTTPEIMAESRWEERVRVLNRAGYARYDESTEQLLGETVGPQVSVVPFRTSRAQMRAEVQTTQMSELHLSPDMGDVAGLVRSGLKAELRQRCIVHFCLSSSASLSAQMYVPAAVRK